jgi:S-adenosylmethionine/arginine decarboxylase-like enzyme
MIEHKHVLIRAEVNKAPGKEDMRDTKKWFRTLVKNLGMKILDGPRIKYVDMPGNKGLTGFCIIETSHIAMHIWDEQSPSLIEFDVYTCGKMDLDIVFNALQSFDPVKIEFMYLDREHGLQLVDSGTRHAA